MTNRILIIVTAFLLSTGAYAEKKEERTAHPHEVRLVIGDMIMDAAITKAVMGGDVHRDYTGCGTDASLFEENHDFLFLPHFGLEYQYRVNKWLGVGMLADFQYTSWKRHYYNNKNQDVSSTPHNFYNLSFMPTARFTYLHASRVNLYSSFSFGIDINGGSEKNHYGNNTDVGFALNLGFIGVSVNFGQWFGAFELGGMYALKTVGRIFMVNYRPFSLSAGYRI